MPKLNFLTITLAASMYMFPAAGFANSLDAPIATQSGLVSGVSVSPTVHTFFGLPFAAPPVGALRWREPQAPASWAGVRKADQFGPACEQDGRPISMVGTAEHPAYNEDCLYLNVWTPASSTAAKLPVMVWIYGGGFGRGRATDPRFDGQNLANKGVVLVTIAYRVGPLGFMAHPELTQESPHQASGNYGLLDQIAALTWVKNNIAGFGGDPANVTIFGESAGSTSVNILQATPLAKGLFRRAIGESTSEMDAAVGLVGLQSLGQAEKAGLDFQAEKGAHSLAELRAIPADMLTATKTPFWPIEPDGYVLPQTVYATFAAGKQNRADVLVGANGDEGAILRQNWIKPETPVEKSTFATLYGAEAGPDRQSDTDNVIWQMWSWANLNAQDTGRKSYLYWFTQFPPASPGRLNGPIHGAEIPYVFNNLSAPMAWTDDDRRLSQIMSEAWTNFAKTGDPNGPGVPYWPALTVADPKVMGLSSTPGEIAMPHQAAVRFIDGYFAARR